MNDPIFIFDGVCKFCSWSTNTLIRIDKKCIVKFASQQSEEGYFLLEQYDLPTEQLDSAIFIVNGSVYRGSDAPIEVCRLMPFPWPIITCFKYIPRFIRDRSYYFFVKRRYQFFGKRERCLTPTEDTLKHFVTMKDLK